MTRRLSSILLAPIFCAALFAAQTTTTLLTISSRSISAPSTTSGTISVPAGTKYTFFTFNGNVAASDLSDSTLSVNFDVQKSPDGTTWSEAGGIGGWTGGVLNKQGSCCVQPVFSISADDLAGQQVRIVITPSRNFTMGATITGTQ